MLLAGAAGAGIVAADLGCGADELGNGRVMAVPVIAVGTMHVARRIVVVMIVVVITVGTVDVRSGGFLRIGHGVPAACF